MRKAGVVGVEVGQAALSRASAPPSPWPRRRRIRAREKHINDDSRRHGALRRTEDEQDAVRHRLAVRRHNRTMGEPSIHVETDHMPDVPEGDRQVHEGTRKAISEGADVWEGGKRYEAE